MNYIQQAFLGNNEWWRHVITNTILLGPFALNILVTVMFPDFVQESYNELQDPNADKNSFLFVNLIFFVFLPAHCLTFCSLV